ncbi:GDSL-type esterase/lipase family protein [Frigoribacterium sp. ACAM 257]|uniref:GDSL-type esterase/lipase family protein n=1 Tax=Frigoribacterium sp. ACAM 257 TaxID=2508998 RepID=UPI00174DBAF7|nr:GDSL-type esterase/lipase family protein [Frigoribacterium sp. ACAM 257]
MNTFRARAAETLLALARPYLALHLGVLGVEIRRAPFPRDSSSATLPGPRAARLLVVGDLAASGYGVLLHGMAFPAQLAGAWSVRTGRGCSWTTIADPLMTVRRAAHHPRLGTAAAAADAVVVALGVPDVLQLTASADVVASVGRLVVRVRSAAGRDVPVLLAGLPPMTQFQGLPPAAARLIGSQLQRLDDALRQVAAQHVGVGFVAFPSWDLGGSTLRRAFSFGAMHRGWAVAVAARLELPDLGSAPDPDRDPESAVVVQAEQVAEEAAVAPDATGGPLTLAA